MTAETSTGWNRSATSSIGRIERALRRQTDALNACWPSVSMAHSVRRRSRQSGDGDAVLSDGDGGLRRDLGFLAGVKRVVHQLLEHDQGPALVSTVGVSFVRCQFCQWGSLSVRGTFAVSPPHARLHRWWHGRGGPSESHRMKKLPAFLGVRTDTDGSVEVARYDDCSWPIGHAGRLRSPARVAGSLDWLWVRSRSARFARPTSSERTSPRRS